MAIQYRFHDSGLLEQQDPDGSWTVHVLTGQEKAMFDKNAPQYANIVADNAARTGLNQAQIWAIGFGESGWQQPAKISFDGGIGLMQITSGSLKQGMSNEQVAVPENNIKLGADFLHTLAGKYGSDIVKMASGYNCGSAKPNSAAPWGLCEYHIEGVGYPYISKVVRAYNYAIQNPLAGDGSVVSGTNLGWLKGIGGPIGAAFIAVGAIVGGVWLARSGFTFGNLGARLRRAF